MVESAGDDRRRSQRKRRILDRVVALRQLVPSASDRPATEIPEPPGDLAGLEARVNHLEAALEGLQDSVYRDAQRYEREFAELRRQLQPENMARSLSGDARRRGL